MKTKKPAPKKAKVKGKPAMKAKAKPAAKKPSKPAAPAKKGLLKKLTGKAMAALSKADKERLKREAAKEKERLKKEAAKAKAEAAKEKERAKKEALKAKADAAKAKEAEKKAAAKAKLDAAKAKEAEKKAAAKAKADAIKEKERAKKEAEKAKIQAAKEAEKAKKLADKEAAKQAKIQAKLDAKQAKKDEKERLKRLARGEVDDEDGGHAPRRGGDDDDDEADYKSIASKGKRGEGISKYGDIDGRSASDLAELREHFAWHEIAPQIANLEFFVDQKNDMCVEKGCDNIHTTLSWCRLHYLKNWKAIQRKKEILGEGKLQEYIEELIGKYPAKYVDAILKDLGDDKDFYKVLNELSITNEFDFEEEDFEADSDSDSDDDIGIEQTFTGSMRYEDTE